jgi:hypothetical protein
MEEMIDFDSWLKNYIPPEVVYYAVYDETTRQVVGIYPESAALEINNKVKIDKEIAEDIQNGIIRMTSCFVDFNSDSVEIIENHSLRKIDDILHRIRDKKFFVIDDPDISVQYNTKLNQVIVSMSQDLQNKKIRYEDETEAYFLITDYNDPHIVYQTVSIKLGDLKKNSQSINFKSPKEKFSVYTRRLFKNYVFEIL